MSVLGSGGARLYRIDGGSYRALTSRIARVVLPGVPHHVTLRGNRRERVFFEPADYALYRDWLAQSCARFGVEVWAYCQMPNHVHLILTPSDAAGLGLALSRAHRHYAGFVNARAPDRPPVPAAASRPPKRRLR